MHITYKGKSKVIINLCKMVNRIYDTFMIKEVYDANDNGIVDNSEKVNGLTVETAVPENAVFTDTVYDDTEIQGRVTAALNNIDTLSLLLNNITIDYLVDEDGNYIIDDDGNRILCGTYESKINDIVTAVQALQEAVSELQSKKYVVYADPPESNEEDN